MHGRVVTIERKGGGNRKIRAVETSVNHCEKARFACTKNYSTEVLFAHNFLVYVEG
jgi:hypothetical protein